MTYKTKSCPHCGKTYAWMEVGRHLGSPFRNCISCRSTFVDKDYVELACMPLGYGRQRKVTFFSIVLPILGLIFIAAGSFQAACGDGGGMDILFIVFGAFFVFGGGYYISKDIATHSERCKQLEQELSLSKKRLSNPAYAKALASIGVDVPKEYLQPHPVKSKQETMYYMEAANGVAAPVPESVLAMWQAEQDRIKNNPAAVELTEAEKKLRDAILHDLYGKRHSSYKGSENHD